MWTLQAKWISCAFMCGFAIFNFLWFFSWLKECNSFLDGECLACCYYSLKIGVFFCQSLRIVARYRIFWVYTRYHKWLFYSVEKVVIKLTYLEILSSRTYKTARAAATTQTWNLKKKARKSKSMEENIELKRSIKSRIKSF